MAVSKQRQGKISFGNTIEQHVKCRPKFQGLSTEKLTRSLKFEDIILVNKNNSVFDDSGLILAIINLARSEVLNISHVTHTPICTAQK